MKENVPQRNIKKKVKITLASRKNCEELMEKQTICMNGSESRKRKKILVILILAVKREANSKQTMTQRH